jgi:hypothetical protein
MKRECLADVADEVRLLAEMAGWRREITRLCCTGSIYVELSRPCNGGREWIVVRVSDHKKVYEGRWIPTYSISKYELDTNMLTDILLAPHGSVGEIL